jgi:hypothetical protein
MEPAAVVQLLKRNDITAVPLQVCDTDAAVLSSICWWRYPTTSWCPLLPQTRRSPVAKSRLVTYVMRKDIRGVASANEVFQQAEDLTSKLLPAMRNVQAALATVSGRRREGDHADGVHHAQGVLPAGHVPAFQDDIDQPMLDFLEQTGSYLMINLYAGTVVDVHSGLSHSNLFDTQLDAVCYGMDNQ